MVRRRFVVNVTEKTRIIYEVKCYNPLPKKEDFWYVVSLLILPSRARLTEVGRLGQASATRVTTPRVPSEPD